MNKFRLELVAKKLDTNPPFNFATWVGPLWKGKPDLSCGTTACALGWATTIPQLRRIGLYLRRSGVMDDGYIALRGMRRSPHATDFEYSREVAQKVFRISEDEARYLFIPPPYHRTGTRPAASATAAQVASHIRAFIERGGIPDGEEIFNY